MPPLARIRNLIGITTAFTVVCVAATTLPAQAAAGDLDPALGGDGKVTTDFGVSPPEPEIGMDTVLQSDGKVVALGRAGVGNAGPGSGAFGLARYLANGDLDAGFGTGGLVKTRFADVGRVAVPRTVVLQPDKKIVAAGWEGTFEQGGNLAIVRYNSDGSLDTAFGNSGKVSLNLCQVGCDQGDNLGDGIRDLKILPDGKILGIGAAGTQDLIIRFNSDGSLDTTFGNGGYLAPQLEVSGHLFAMELVGGGKFLAAGTGLTATQDDFLLARFNADGSLDTTFGNGGAVTTNFTPLSDIAFEMALTREGKIVLGGSAGALSPFGGEGDNAIALARYNPDGSLDTTFGGGGTATKNLSARQDVIRNVSIQPSGQILAVGQQDEQTSFPSDPATGHIAVLRYNTDGTIDTSFGTGGTATPVVAGVGEVARGSEIDQSGRLVLVGGARMPDTGQDFAVLRLQLS